MSARLLRTTTPYDQLLLDLFTCAIEGGINYWASVSSYHWTNQPDSESPEVMLDAQDVLGFRADIHDTAGSAWQDSQHYHINRRIMAKGYQRAWLQRHSINWSTSTPPLPHDVAGIEDWDYDAGDADIILQLGLWDEVRYG